MKASLPNLLLLASLLPALSDAEPWSARRHESRFLIKPKASASSTDLIRLHAGKGCELIRRFPALGDIQLLSAPAGRAVADLIREYQQNALVEYAEPDYYVRLDTTFPNDPSFLDGTEWGLNNAGQNGGLANADIDAPEGWSARTSASNIIVAVVDSGIRYTHEDLALNLWTNAIAGGHGTNAVAGTSDPMDDNGHGTHIAGVIGARGNNGVGIVGVGWRVQLMACKFTDQYGNASLSDAIACLDYSRANGAHIVNASWGLDSFSLSLSNAVATLREAGILLVAAAGNSAHDADQFPHYPACYDLDNVMSVMATTRRDEIYALSNVGATNVDLAAPGDEIYSTDSLSDSAYAYDYGTSMATAFVSGAAALLRASHPADSPAEIRSRLLSAVDTLPVLDGPCLSGGRLNLRKALDVPVSTPLLAISQASLVEFTLALQGDPGRTYLLETSPNLRDWSPMATNATSLNGSFAITNVTSNLPAQFYRARLRP